MKYEYLVEEFDNSIATEDLETQLDMHGYEEWDLVNIICGEKNKFIFKRQIKMEQ